MLRTLAVICLSLLLVACGESQGPRLHGHLLFASGNYIGDLDLQEGASTAIANRGDVTVSNISPYEADRLLLSEITTVEGREVGRISWIEPSSGLAGTLHQGVVARYLPQHAAVVWDDGTRLRVSPRRRDSGVGAEIMRHPLNQVSVILDVGDDGVLFETGMSEQRVIHGYDVVSRELRRLDKLGEVCRLAGAVWIPDRGQLACAAAEADSEDSSYLLVDLEGAVQGRLELPRGKRFIALAYAPDQQLLLLAQPWRTLLGRVERFAVWAYDFSDGHPYRIVRNQYLGESAVYRPDRRAGTPLSRRGQ